MAFMDPMPFIRNYYNIALIELMLIYLVIDRVKEKIRNDKQ